MSSHDIKSLQAKRATIVIQHYGFADHITKSTPQTSYIWSFIGFLFNSYILLTIVYWICTGTMPSGTLLLFDTTIEIILLTELFLRFLIKWKLPDIYPEMNVLHIRGHDGKLRWLMTIIGSLPITIIYSALGSHDSTVVKVFSRLMALKFLRSFEL
jgi:hypothetical protein